MTSSVYAVPSPDVVFTDLGSEGVIMHSITGEAFRLNASGVLLWRTCPADAQALARALTQHWRISPEQADADVSAWITALSARGLITITEEPVQ